MSSLANIKDDDSLTPRRLELSLSHEDGSLLTAPLSTVLLSATDALYSDLYNMVHGELEVAQAVGEKEDEEAAVEASLKKERMSNLSFAQRRHELAFRLNQHGKALTHVSALTAAAATSDFANSTRVSTKALQHARTAWVQNDEAQDALYFFHAQLFPARQAPHDVYGALDILQRGTWIDLPTELKLVVDRYDTSREQSWSASETAERWHMAVRDKLLRGELGWMQSQNNVTVPWRISVKSGIVTLTHGNPKMMGASQTPQYPLEAHLTVLSTAVPAEWTLLSIEVRALAKTGEYNHQLDTSNRQRFDLHRLCVLAMNREESRVRDGDSTDEIPRPLNCLFSVAQTFSLSWQLEILSAQAQALRRGAWSAGTSSTLIVTPVRFDSESDQIGILYISFWTVDDRYGAPYVDDLHPEEGSQKTVEGDISPVASKLALSVSADRNRGIYVSLSGGRAVLAAVETHSHMKTTAEQLLESASSPFALSVSDALTAATALCSELMSKATVSALTSQTGDLGLPWWLQLLTERGTINVAAQISYNGAGYSSHGHIPLFQMGIDLRTGSFVCLFPRSTDLLRRLACNDTSASESMTLQMARLAQNKRKGAPTDATGRIIRDAFEGLVRSLNLLGQRVGVGGAWKDHNNESASLRQRAIQLACGDVRQSLMTCCGIASVYGLSSLALGVANGVSVAPDIAGGPLNAKEGSGYLSVPPVGVVIEQNLVQKSEVGSSGERKKYSYAEVHMFAMCSSVCTETLTLHALEIATRMDSPASAPNRIRCSPVALKAPKDNIAKSKTENGHGRRPTKRMRVDSAKLSSNEADSATLLDEVDALSGIIASTMASL